ncbi:MAG: hypothetical protein HY606_01015 [Planctomycetes bacterium]|nr:hypothetical protein [Planctomycetota bacterium]
MTRKRLLWAFSVLTVITAVFVLVYTGDTRASIARSLSGNSKDSPDSIENNSQSERPVSDVAKFGESDGKSAADFSVNEAQTVSYKLKGRVIDNSENGIPNYSVRVDRRIIDSETSWYTTYEGEAVTDWDGYFSFNKSFDSEPRANKLFISGDMLNGQIITLQNGSQEHQLVLNLLDYCETTVRVMSSRDNFPIEDALVEMPCTFFESDEDKADYSTALMTDSYGRAAIRLPVGKTVTLKCIKTGYLPLEKEIYIQSNAKGQAIDITLIEGNFQLFGICIDENGSPISDIIVKCQSDAQAITEADGKFIFRHLAQESALLNFEHKVFAHPAINIKTAGFHTVVMKRAKNFTIKLQIPPILADKFFTSLPEETIRDLLSTNPNLNENELRKKTADTRNVRLKMEYQNGAEKFPMRGYNYNGDYQTRKIIIEPNFGSKMLFLGRYYFSLELKESTGEFKPYYSSEIIVTENSLEEIIIILPSLN